MTYLNLLFFILIPILGFSQGKVEDSLNVTSQYTRGKYDSLKYVKNRLLYRAFDSAIDHRLRQLNKDPASFRKNFNQKFEEEFTEKKEEYLKKVGYSDKLPEVQKQKIIGQLKAYRLSQKIAFSELYRSVQTYSIQRVWQAASNPRVRKMKAKINLDTKKLLEVYRDYSVKGQVVSEVIGKRFFVNLKYDLLGFEWSDLSFRKEEEFYNGIVSAWIKWVNKNTEIPKLGYEIKRFDDIFTDNLTDEDVLLNVYLKIKKINFDRDFQRYKVDLGVDFSVTTKDEQVLYEGNLQKKTKEFFNVEINSVPNLIANEAYRIPLNDFVTIRSALKKKRARKKKDQIVISSYKNFDLVNQFIGLLNTYGVEINLKSEISLLTSQNVTLNIYYQGTQERLLQIVEFIKSNSLALNMTGREFPLKITL